MANPHIIDHDIELPENLKGRRHRCFPLAFIGDVMRHKTSVFEFASQLDTFAFQDISNHDIGAFRVEDTHYFGPHPFALPEINAVFPITRPIFLSLMVLNDF